MKNLPKLAIVVPCYNEEAVILDTFTQLLHKLNKLIIAKKITDTSFILLIDDGSKDNTWSIIAALNRQYTACKGIKLSRNFGHQAALLCGLHAVTEQVDCAISIDADLQDDIEMMDDFIAQYQAGFDIVYGVRKERDKDTFFKKYTALAFYRFMQLLGTKLIHNHADYRLVSQRVLQILLKFNDNSLFLRGTFPLIGYKSCCVYYNRKPRMAGETKYSLSKMLNFAINGIIALSIAPLRLITFLGITSFAFSGLIILYFIVIGLFHHQHMPLWLFILAPICFMGSIQLISLGIIGEYLSKIYYEAKANPHYIIAYKNL